MSPYLWNLNQLGALSSAELHKVIQHIKDINEFPFSKHYSHEGRLRLAGCTTQVHTWITGRADELFLPFPVAAMPSLHHSHIRRKGVSISACIRMGVLERREHTWALFHTTVMAWWIREGTPGAASQQQPGLSEHPAGRVPPRAALTGEIPAFSAPRHSSTALSYTATSR